MTHINIKTNLISNLKFGMVHVLHLENDIINLIRI